MGYILVEAGERGQASTKALVSEPEYREHGVMVWVNAETRAMKIETVERFYPYSAIKYIEHREDGS